MCLFSPSFPTLFALPSLKSQGTEELSFLQSLFLSRWVVLHPPFTCSSEMLADEQFLVMILISTDNTFHGGMCWGLLSLKLLFWFSVSPSCSSLSEISNCGFISISVFKDFEDFFGRLEWLDSHNRHSPCSLCSCNACPRSHRCTLFLLFYSSFKLVAYCF